MARVIGFPIHRAQNDRILRAFLGFSSMSVAGKFEYQAIRSSSSMRQAARPVHLNDTAECDIPKFCPRFACVTPTLGASRRTFP